MWSEYPVNRWLVAVSAVLLLLYLNRFYTLVPYLARALSDWKGNLRLEASMQRIRDRNAIALCMIPPFCLISDRYSIITVRHLDFCPDGLRVLSVIGVFVLYLLVRWMLYRICSPGKDEASTYKVAKSCEGNYFIMIVAVLLLSVGVLAVLNVKDHIVREILLYELGLLYLLALVGKAQILSSSCSPFTTFLYLCALEIIPTGLLILFNIRF